MKKNYIMLLALIIMSVISTYSQSPNQFKYQAVLRDGSGAIKANQNASIMIDILQGSPTGTSMFNETHNVSTDLHGIVNLNIGEVEEGLNTIDWSDGEFYLKITVDGTEMGTSQMQWVPFALYAKSSGDIDNNMPQVFTDNPKNITTTSAECSGNIVMRGDTEINERGICWGEQQNPTIEDNITSEGSGMGFFSSSLTDLEAGNTYYARAYATNSYGTSYGNQVMFKTTFNVLFPTVTTAVAINITANAAVSGGNVTSTGGDAISARGVCWSINQNPTIADSKTEDGTAEGEFQSQISGLSPGTYHVRAYATNIAGTGYGNLVSFTTEKTLPVLTTKNISDISAMGAVSGGSIPSAGGGTISERGICWSDSPNPTISNEKTISPANSGSFGAAIAKAAPNTKYYIKAYASNEIGTGYGDEKTFTTSDAAYYTSFEAGMTPVNWYGPFTVTSETAFDGSYSLMSLYDTNCDAEFSTILNVNGQLSFYYSFLGDGAVLINLYIDDLLIAIYNNDGSGWRQGLASIEAGTHTIKFQYVDRANNNMPYNSKGKCYIDQITITK